MTREEYELKLEEMDAAELAEACGEDWDAVRQSQIEDLVAAYEAELEERTDEELFGEGPLAELADGYTERLLELYDEEHPEEEAAYLEERP